MNLKILSVLASKPFWNTNSKNTSGIISNVHNDLNFVK